MPTSKIKKDAREGKGTVKSLEKKWDRAKDAAGKKGGKQNWPLTMHIYENMTKSGVELNAATRLMKIQAATPQWEGLQLMLTTLLEVTKKDERRPLIRDVKKAAAVGAKAIGKTGAEALEKWCVANPKKLKKAVTESIQGEDSYSGMSDIVADAMDEFLDQFFGE